MASRTMVDKQLLEGNEICRQQKRKIFKIKGAHSRVTKRYENKHQKPSSLEGEGIGSKEICSLPRRRVAGGRRELSSVIPRPSGISAVYETQKKS